MACVCNTISLQTCRNQDCLSWEKKNSKNLFHKTNQGFLNNDKAQMDLGFFMGLDLSLEIDTKFVFEAKNRYLG